ncbi:hypothetical protein [Enterococcus sp. CWB-B31]|uniref:hypothetical protein n=1 Tax=Enterococcus sp. CWB-B31 TaxID=2885159 RepID=UPI001E513C5D|nr:hypothetical protein [Enterococcus sp. CWB-B31]MCB5954809.1 hypothetical protein [Enterococcus sp. CWB-B31]
MRRVIAGAKYFMRRVIAGAKYFMRRVIAGAEVFLLKNQVGRRIIYSDKSIVVIYDNKREGLLLLRFLRRLESYKDWNTVYSALGGTVTYLCHSPFSFLSGRR